MAVAIPFLSVPVFNLVKYALLTYVMGCIQETAQRSLSEALSASRLFRTGRLDVANLRVHRSRLLFTNGKTVLLITGLLTAVFTAGELALELGFDVQIRHPQQVMQVEALLPRDNNGTSNFLSVADIETVNRALLSAGCINSDRSTYYDTILLSRLWDGNRHSVRDTVSCPANMTEGTEHEALNLLQGNTTLVDALISDIGLNVVQPFASPPYRERNSSALLFNMTHEGDKILKRGEIGLGRNYVVVTSKVVSSNVQNRLYCASSTEQIVARGVACVLKTPNYVVIGVGDKLSLSVGQIVNFIPHVEIPNYYRDEQRLQSLLTASSGLSDLPIAERSALAFLADQAVGKLHAGYKAENITRSFSGDPFGVPLVNEIAFVAGGVLIGGSLLLLVGMKWVRKYCGTAELGPLLQTEACLMRWASEVTGAQSCAMGLKGSTCYALTDRGSSQHLGVETEEFKATPRVLEKPLCGIDATSCVMTNEMVV